MSASGRCSVFEIAVAVLAAHQRRAVVAAGDLAHIGRDVADGEADAPVVRRVRIGAVDQPHVVQRHLAGGEFQHRRLALIDIHHDLLAARQQVLGREGVAMRHLIQLVRRRDHPHGAVRRGAVGERHPGGDDVGRLQPPVGGILVPRDVAWIARLLDEERGAPAQDVGADDVLHRVEDARMADQVVQPGEQQMRLVPHGALHAAAARLERLQPAAQRTRLGARSAPAPGRSSRDRDIAARRLRSGTSSAAILFRRCDGQSRYSRATIAGKSGRKQQQPGRPTHAETYLPRGLGRDPGPARRWRRPRASGS